MRTETYITSKGRTLYRPVLTVEEAEEMMGNEDSLGFCLACGDDAYGCEPDAEKYECESCGKRMRYGIEQLMLRGIIRFIE